MNSRSEAQLISQPAETSGTSGGVQTRSRSAAAKRQYNGEEVGQVQEKAGLQQSKRVVLSRMDRPAPSQQRQPQTGFQPHSRSESVAYQAVLDIHQDRPPLECDESYCGAGGAAASGAAAAAARASQPQTLAEYEDQYDALFSDRNDVQDGTNVGCPHYVREVYQYLRQAEIARRPDPAYMERSQRDVNAAMRGILVDWMVEVAEEYKLQPETLFLAVSYVDRYLSRVEGVQRSRLQLVGVTSMMLAAKYEEIYAPHVDEFVYITDNTYRKEELLEMEWRVLDTLEYQLTQPTTRVFLSRVLRAAQSDKDTEHLCSFLAEMALLDYRTAVTFLPSEIAAASLILSSHLLGKDLSWNKYIEALSGGYRPSTVKECCRTLFRAVQNSYLRPTQLPAIREKYAAAALSSVSKIIEPAVLQGGELPDSIFP